MKKLIFLALATLFLWGCYTQIGTVREDEGYQSFESKKEKNYSYYTDDYNSWYYQSYVYRYYLPYPRYHLFFRYYTPGFVFGWGEWWYYDPFWWDRYWWWDWDWYWWDRYYSYLYFPGWYYYPWWYRAPIIIVINNPYYPVSGGKAIVYRTRNFGSTRSGGGRSGDETGVTFSPPTRSAPAVNSGGSVQGGSSEGTLRKPSGSSGRETPGVERSGVRSESPRNIGSTRGTPAPRVEPRSGNEGQKPRNDSTPPRRSGSHRSSQIQLYRDYDTGRSMLIGHPKHFQSSQPQIGLTSHYSGMSNGFRQSDNTATQDRRQTGSRRK
jgi:hypothetical protein